MKETTLHLKIGPQEPADASEKLLESLSEVEVTRSTEAPSGFQLTFKTGRYDPLDETTKSEWPLLQDDTLQPFNRVQLLVEPKGSDARVLIDGFITRMELNLGRKEGSAIVVTGEDVSLKMDLFETSAEYENLKTSEIVKKILGYYSSVGIKPDVKAPEGESAPTDYVPQQNCSDRFYLRMLAALNGFAFYVQPGKTAGDNLAYWGPPISKGNGLPEQPSLITNMGRRNNVQSLSLGYDALAPTLAYGQVLDLSKKPAESFAVAIGATTQNPDLSKEGAIPSQPNPANLAKDPASYSSQLKELAVRGSLSNYPGYPPTDAKQIAQARLNQSITEVLKVEGELDTGEYGAILEVPGLVSILGIGDKFGGAYYVKEVTHSFKYEHEAESKWKVAEYRQKFVLTREGFGYKSPPAP